MYKAVGDAYQSSTKQYGDGSLGVSSYFSNAARAQQYFATQVPHPAATRCPAGTHAVRHFNRTLCLPPQPLHGAVNDGSLGVSSYFSNAARTQQYFAAQAARGACPPGKVAMRRFNRNICVTPRALHGAVNDGSLGVAAALLPQLTRPQMPPRHSMRGMGNVYRDGVLGTDDTATIATPGGTATVSYGPIALPWYKTPLGIGAGVAAGAGLVYFLMKRK